MLSVRPFGCHSDTVCFSQVLLGNHSSPKPARLGASHRSQLPHSACSPFFLLCSIVCFLSPPSVSRLNTVRVSGLLQVTVSFCSVTFRTEINWSIYRESLWWVFVAGLSVISQAHATYTHQCPTLDISGCLFFHLSLSTGVWVWTFPQKCAILNVSLIFFALVSWLFVEDDLVDCVFFFPPLISGFSDQCCFLQERRVLCHRRRWWAGK